MGYQKRQRSKSKYNQNNRNTVRALLLLLLLLTLTYAWLQWQEKHKENEPMSLVQEEVIYKPLYWAVAQPAYPPFTERGIQGEMIGMDVELLQAIAEQSGIEVTIRPQELNGLLHSLDTGSADIVIGGINITPERRQQYLFTRPYLTGKWAVLSQNKLSNWEQLSGKAIAVTDNALSERYVQNFSNVQPVRLSSVYLGVNAVEKNNAYAILDSDVVLKHYQQANPNWYLLTQPGSETLVFAFAVKKDNVLLKKKLDAGLAAIKSTGLYQAILAKYGQ